VKFRIPKDDGREPRYNDYVRGNEVVSFNVEHWLANDPSVRDTYAIIEGDYSVPSTRGGIIPQSFTIDQSLVNGTGDSNLTLPIQRDSPYEVWLGNNGLLGAPADGDADLDGFSNYQEYVMGTDPNNPTDENYFEVDVFNELKDPNDESVVIIS